MVLRLRPKRRATIGVGQVFCEQADGRLAQLLKLLTRVLSVHMYQYDRLCWYVTRGRERQ
jgi:hypothetical protein